MEKDSTIKPARRELNTARLHLRQFVQGDLDAYAEMCADDDVMRFLGGTLSRDDAWRQMALFRGHWELLGYGLYAVVERATGEFVGRVGYLNPEGWPGFEVGWTLRRSAWGKGFATEAAHTVVNHAFEEMGVDRIISLIAPDNASSARVAARIGERVTGETVIRGFTVNIHSLTRDEWSRG